MPNIDKLRAAMEQRNLKVPDVAKAMKVDPATLYRRLEKQGVTFTVSEVAAISQLLDLTPSELTAIFFAE